MQGLERLMGTLLAKYPINDLPVDLEESELMEVLEELESIDLHVFETDASNAQRARAYIRYLSALWPEASIVELGQRIHSLMNNRNVSFSDVMTVLRGERLSERAQLDDLRIVLRGGQLGNAQMRTREVPVPMIQGIGKCLMNGSNLAETARIMRVSIDTVRNIERFLGLRSAYKQRMLSAAVDAVRDGVSIREFARTHGVSKGQAEYLLRDGRSVLIEIGEAH
jgi:transposase-like protein